MEAPLILLVEDTAELREDLSYVMLDAGYRVVATDCGAAALTAFQEARPDFVICDIQLPDTDGLSLIAAMRACRSGAGNTPALVVSAFSDPQLQSQAAGLGIDGFLIKPVDYSDLLALVGRSFEQANSRP